MYTSTLKQSILLEVLKFSIENIQKQLQYTKNYKSVNEIVLTTTVVEV